jgi:adenylosuccinate synthase
VTGQGGPGWHVVFDLGFGDAGKGRVVDALVRRTGATLVVRAHGGAQAGHTVVAPDGRRHTFSSLGAGSFVPGVGTHLGPDFVLHPLALVVEAQVLAKKGVDVWPGLTIDARARVTSPFQQAAGRLRELGRSPRHGTCGVGVGETVAQGLAAPDELIRAGDLGDAGRLRRRLRAHQERALALPVPDDPAAAPERAFLLDPGAVERVVAAWVAADLPVVSPERAERRLREARGVVFEGAQGVLLDEVWGLHPHTTWSDCTPRGALALAGDRPVARWAVTRTYATRHGEGPFPHEDPAFGFPEPDNADGGWQGRFRRGPLDGVWLRYALRVAGGADHLAVTHGDRRVGSWVTAWGDGTTDVDPGSPGDLAHRAALGERWRRAGGRRSPLPPDAVAEHLAEALGVPLGLVTHGPVAGEERWVGAAR